MSLHKDQAIILSTKVFGESDKIVRFFTLTSGKVSGIAKGAKKSQKRFVNTLELFNVVNIEYFEKFGKGLVRIDNADLLEPNQEIGSGFRRMGTAGFITEFVEGPTTRSPPFRRSGEARSARSVPGPSLTGRIRKGLFPGWPTHGLPIRSTRAF